jgi:hypothetical protein
MWDVEKGVRLHTLVPRWNPRDCAYSQNSGEVLAMAASDDGRFLALGGSFHHVIFLSIRMQSYSFEDGELLSIMKPCSFSHKSF